MTFRRSWPTERVCPLWARSGERSFDDPVIVFLLFFLFLLFRFPFYSVFLLSLSLSLKHMHCGIYCLFLVSALARLLITPRS